MGENRYLFGIKNVTANKTSKNIQAEFFEIIMVSWSSIWRSSTKLVINLAGMEVIEGYQSNVISDAEKNVFQYSPHLLYPQTKKETRP